MATFNVPKPCNDCPFLKVGGIRLTRSRAKQICNMMLSSDGGEFPCHKTVDEEDSSAIHWKHCAGALIFAEKHGRTTQSMRIAERLRLYDYKAFLAENNADEIIDSYVEMILVLAGHDD